MLTLLSSTYRYVVKKAPRLRRSSRCSLPDAAQAIGAKRKVAVLSEDSIRKNRQRHLELTVEDYQALPGLGESPTLAVQDGENTVVLVKRKPR